MGTHLRVLCESYPMNNNMIGFRWFSKIMESWSLNESWKSYSSSLSLSQLAAVGCAAADNPWWMVSPPATRGVAVAHSTLIYISRGGSTSLTFRSPYCMCSDGYSNSALFKQPGRKLERAARVQPGVYLNTVQGQGTTIQAVSSWSEVSKYFSPVAQSKRPGAQ